MVARLLPRAAHRAVNAFLLKLSKRVSLAAKKQRKPNRLLTRADFLRAASKGKRFVAPAFILQFFSAPDCARARYGLTATKKLGNAVTRNRARRRLRSLAETLIVPKGHAGDYVLIAKDASVTRPYADMLADLEKAMKVLKCLN